MHGTVLPPLKKGWQATLDLRFQQAGGKTVLASAQHVGPLTVQRPFYPEEETCHLYLLHPPGGIVGGDELTISAHLAPGCHTLITMPGASKFYRSSGAQALVRQQLTLAPQATLEWLPQDAIFFPGANARLFTTFHLCASSRLLAWDLLCLGATDALLDGVRDALAPLGLYAGASLTDRLLTVRFLSDDNLICQRVMRDVWQFLRPHLTGKSPVLPRIWLT